jgi:Uma2 family endonuclease
MLSEDDEMSTSTTLRLSLADYNRLIAEDAFRPLGKRRIELIYGELREVTPPGPTHAECVDRLARWSFSNTDPRLVTVRIQNPIHIPAFDSAPEPDVAWTRFKSYSKQHPQPRDILLLIEAADNSLSEDLGEMSELYARAGIKDYWVVNIPDFCIEVFRQPKRGRYMDHRAYQSTDDLAPLAFPKVHLPISGLFSGTL